MSELLNSGKGGCTMKRSLFVWIVVCCTSPVFSQSEELVVRELAKEVTDQVAEKWTITGSVPPIMKSMNLALFPMESVGFADNGYGLRIYDQLSSALTKHKSFHLVEREKLGDLVEEQNLSQFGLLQKEDAQRIGKLVSVDAILTGRLYRTEKGMEWTVRVVDTVSGRLLAVVTKQWTSPNLPLVSVTQPTGTGNSLGKQPGYVGQWRVVETAPYLLEKDILYEKFVLNPDLTFSLSLTNDNGKPVEIRGTYAVQNRNIDYQAKEMWIDGRSTTFQKFSKHLEGTLYMVKGQLYFNYTSMDRNNRVRLDAMDKRYRCVAERSQ